MVESKTRRILLCGLILVALSLFQNATAAPSKHPYCLSDTHWKELQYGSSGTASIDGLTANVVSNGNTLGWNGNVGSRPWDASEHTTINSVLTGGANLFYSVGAIEGLDEEFTQTFDGRAVYEVYLHFTSIDQLQLIFDSSVNPDIGWELLSASDDTGDLGVFPDFAFQDVLEGDQDGTYADADADGDLGKSADGTVRFYSVSGNPITQLIWRFTEDTVSLPSRPDGFFIATEVCMPLDYSDAPASYGEASHSLTGGVKLGATVDSDMTQFTGPAANGDDADGSDDEDSLASIPLLSTGHSDYTISVTATNTTALPSRIVAWLDFDRNGTFDANEAAVRMVPAGTNSNSFDITWANIPPDIQSGITYLRLRHTTDAITTGEASGGKSDGEVEDFSLTIESRPPIPPKHPYCSSDISWKELQYGPSGTASIDGLTANVVSNGNTLGWNGNVGSRPWDASEHTTINSVLTGGANLFYSVGAIEGLDEEFTQTFDGRAVYEVYLHFTSIDQLQLVFDSSVNPDIGWELLSASDDTGDLGVFPDFAFQDVLEGDQDGTYADADADGDLGKSADGTVRFYSVSGNPITQLIWRFTEDTVSLPSRPDGFFIATEVCMPLDYSDAPASYGEASHSLTGGVKLGATVDSDMAQFTGPAANGDDADGSDDEDSLASIPLLSTGHSDYTISVTATNTTALPSRIVAWLDFDRNGTFDANEAAVRMVPAGTNSNSFDITWANIPPNIELGTTYLRLRHTTDAINVRSASDNKSNGEVEDYVMEIVSGGVTVSGKVYIDSDSNMSPGSGEKGIGDTVLVLYNQLSGVCRSTTTSANGEYQFINVSNNNYQLYQAHGETVPVPQNCDVALYKNPIGYQSTTPDVLSLTVSGIDLTEQNFGEVAGTNSTVSGNTGTGITFMPNNQSEVLPGNTAFYTHVFSSSAAGSVKFTALAGGNNVNGWTHTLYLDGDCNGVLNGTEANTVIAGLNLGIAEDSKLCIINKVYGPANVQVKDRYNVKTTATFTFAGGGVLPAILNVNDLTVASQSGDSRLELKKTVENITQGTPETSTLNQAKPGDFLKYRLYYKNTGTGTIADLRVNDTVPVHTKFSGNNVCNTTPLGMTCASNIVLDELSWVFDGNLIGGAQGNVSYEVMVNN